MWAYFNHQREEVLIYAHKFAHSNSVVEYIPALICLNKNEYNLGYYGYIISIIYFYYIKYNCYLKFEY